MIEIIAIVMIIPATVTDETKYDDKHLLCTYKWKVTYPLIKNDTLRKG